MTTTDTCRCDKCRLDKPKAEFQHGLARYASICQRCLQVMGYRLPGAAR